MIYLQHPVADLRQKRRENKKKTKKITLLQFLLQFEPKWQLFELNFDPVWGTPAKHRESMLMRIDL